MALLVALMVGLATAPRPMQKQAPEFFGVYTMCWCGTDAKTEFLCDGGYTCKWYSTTWVGTWKVKDNVLYVRETSDAANPEWIDWSVDLSTQRMPDGGAVTLRKLP